MDLTPRAPSLPFQADSPLVVLFRGAEQILATDPILGSVGVKVRAWTGDPAENRVPNDATEMPLVRITPAAAASGWENESEHKYQMILDLACYTKGVNVDDPLNLAYYVAKAFFCDDKARRDVVDALIVGRSGPTDPTPSRAQVIRAALTGTSEPKPLGESSVPFGMEIHATIRVIVYLTT